MDLTFTQAPILGAAFAMGFAAAAPIGPVNMVAIRRGIVGRWTHTLACGAGSAFGDMLLFALVLLGGHSLLDLKNPTVQMILAAAGMALLLPLGGYFLVRAIKKPLQAYMDERKNRKGYPPKHLIADVATGMVLTILNPASLFYWIGVTSNWMPTAKLSLGAGTAWWGLLMAAAGLMTWFSILTFFVRFMPNRIGPTFFRIVNLVCGTILLAFAGYCGYVVWVHAAA